MIPFIVGGVALAATGYGVAKYFEDDNNREHIQDWLLEKSDSFDKYEKDIDDFFDEIQGSVDECFKEDDKHEEKTESFYVEIDEKAYEPQEDESFGKYDLAKIELYNTTFIELTTALKEIQNLPQEVHIPQSLKFAQTIYPFEKVTKELEKDFDKHREILQNAKQYIDSKLDSLDAIIISGNDFEKYSDEDKKLVQNLVEIFKLIDHAIFTKTTNDGVSIAREIKRAFSKADMLMNNQKEA